MSAVAQYKINLPRDLYEEIRAAAKANYRSINQEIVARLARSLCSETEGRVD